MHSTEGGKALIQRANLMGGKGAHICFTGLEVCQDFGYFRTSSLKKKDCKIITLICLVLQLPSLNPSQMLY